MKSNFYFLKERFEEYYNLAVEAESNIKAKPRTSAIYSRLAMEELIKWIYQYDSELSHIELTKTTLDALMYNESFKALLDSGNNLISGMTLIRKNGNNAIHNKADVSMRYAYLSIQNLYEFCKWVYYTYVDSAEKLPFSFDGSLIPAGDGSGESTATVKALQTDLDKIKSEAENALKVQNDELEQLRKEVARLKAQNKEKVIEPFTFNPITEAETRKGLIDVMLEELGWNLDEPNCREYEVEGMPNTTGKGYVDYVLWGDDGKPLAVVEAKRTMHDPRKGQQQAKLYADCLERRFKRRPVIFYSNGYKTWIWDDVLYPHRLISGFQKRDELERTIKKRNRLSLSEYQVNDDITNRPYQKRAVKSVAECFEKGRRKALLVMATGTGKTRTAISIVDMMTKQRWVKNILFLADRNALVIQAKRNFTNLLGALSCKDITKEKFDIDVDRMIFSTYPTMMNKIDSERINDLLVYSPSHFDLIIIDEAHRSVYQKYKAIFEYFDTLLIGLTATPKSEVDKNTYTLFELEDHNPTDYYELDEAVREGWLVPPKQISVTTKFNRDGIKYRELTEEDREKYEEDFTDSFTGEMPEEIASSDLNKFVFNQDTVDKVLNQLMTDGLKIEGGDKLGKTIVFAKNHDHAIYIQERFNALYPHYKGKFARVIDNYETYAQNLLEEFSDPAKMPQIAISVDMLDTGIDVPEILNLVFFKVVRSSSKFWQMIGRGTRTCRGIFGIPEDETDKSKDKKEFLIFDYCGNFEFFDVYPDGFETKVPVGVSQRIMECQISLSIAISEIKSTQTDEKLIAFKTMLLDKVHESVMNFNRNSFVVKAELELVNKYSIRESWNLLSLADTSEIFDRLTPLVQPLDSDEAARNFNLMMFKFMLAITNGCEPYEKYINKIKVIGNGLLKKLNIPDIKEKESVLRSITSDEFWCENMFVLTLENIREEIVTLIKYLEKIQRKIVYTNLEDEVTVSDAKEVISTYVASENYKQRVEKYIRENENIPVIQKLKRNIPISQTDIAALENILFDDSKLGTREDFVKEYVDQPLGVFIRSIVGLDRNAADEAFSIFLNTGNLSVNQNKFISMIIDYLTVEGQIARNLLFESPFTQFHTEGVYGVFGEENTKMILEILDEITHNAMAA
ncbi:MAG: DEAD/DEAH box helicase family protein [Bacteroidales bacterium]